MEAGPVHHGDRRRPDRLPLEIGKHVLERTTQILLHPLAHIGKGDGRPGVQAGAEFVGHVVTEHPRGRGDDLPEFHERPAQILEALAQWTGQLGSG